MSIRENLKKRQDPNEGKVLIQTRHFADLITAVDAQIERDRRSGLAVDRTAVIEAGLISYLKESGAKIKKTS